MNLGLDYGRVISRWPKQSKKLASAILKSGGKVFVISHTDRPELATVQKKLAKFPHTKLFLNDAPCEAAAWKAQLCKKLKIDLFIDDLADTVRAVQGGGVMALQAIPEIRATVVITTYNRPDTLIRAVLSVFEQDFENYEILIVNDGGETIDFEGVRVLNLPKNRGVSAARNAGASYARGDYVVFLDDDDELTTDFLSTTVPILDRCPDIHGVGGGRIIKYPEREVYEKPRDPNALYMSIDDGSLLRRNAVLDVKYDEELLTDEDADFGIRFMQRYKMHMLDLPLLIKHGHEVGDPRSFSTPSERRIGGLARFLSKNLEYLSQDSRELRYVLRLAGRNYCLAGDMITGRFYLLWALRVRPSLRGLTHFLASLCGKRCYALYWEKEVFLIRLLRSWHG